VSRTYVVAAHDTQTITWMGKVPMTTTTHHEAKYYAVVKIGGKYSEISVSDTYFRLLSSGCTVDCWYVIGRYSNDIYLKRIENF
jgi:hypothetical protein